LGTVIGGLAILGLGLMAVGTDTGREVLGNMAEANERANERRRQRVLNNAERMAELKHELTNKELELVRVKNRPGFNWREEDRLEGEIKVLKRAIDRESV
jgi:hypothetical protein